MTRKITIWLVLNVFLLGLAYFAFLTPQPPIVVYIAVGVICLTFIPAFILVGAAAILVPVTKAMQKSFKELGGNEMTVVNSERFKAKHNIKIIKPTDKHQFAPNWLSLIFGLTLLAILVVSGHYILSVLYTICLAVTVIAKHTLSIQTKRIKEMVKVFTQPTQPLAQNTDVIDI